MLRADVSKKIVADSPQTQNPQPSPHRRNCPTTVRPSQWNFVSLKMQFVRRISLLAGSCIIMFSLLTFEACVTDDVGEVCPGNCTVFRGTFTTRDGKELLAGLPLELSWIGSGAFNAPRRKIAEGTTDENGMYEFSFYAEDREIGDGLYVLYYSVESHDLLSSFDEPTAALYIESPGTRGATRETNYTLPRKGSTIEFVLKNPDAIPSGDLIVCNAYAIYGTESDQRLLNTGTFESVKYDSNTEYTSEAAADQRSVFITISRRSGVLTQKRDTVYIAKNVKFKYELKY